MKRLFLALLTSPVLAGSTFFYLSLLSPLQAAEPNMTSESQVCVWSSHSQSNLICTRVKDIVRVKAQPTIDLATNPQDSPEALEFSEEESNAAIALFGCDCPLCVNSMRQLRMMATGAA
jgi:hypothetical protein